MRRPFDPLPVWALATLTGADPDPKPQPDPPADPQPADSDADVEAGRKALALVRTQGVKAAIGDLKGKDGKPKYAWQDVDTVFDLIDRDKVSVDLDTGAVSGLDDQLDALAKAKPFLLKQEESTGGFTSTGTPPSGGNTGHSPHRKNAASYAAEAPGIYGTVLGRLAGVSIDN